MSKSSNRSHGFWIFYLSFIIFLCIICIIGLSFISSILEDYESAQPYKVVEKYINKLENEDYSYVLGFSGFQYTNFAKADECIEVLKERYSGKELYYLESFCTDEMMGKSFDFFYKWYFAIISYLDYKKGIISGIQLSDLFQRVMTAGIGFAGEYLRSLFQQMMMVYFLEFQESHNTQGVLDFYNLLLRQARIKYYV